MSKISSTFVKLTNKQLEQKYLFIENYKKANNAADGSNVDANSNVCNKNVATMMSEINKDINIQIKRYCITKQIEKMWGKELADEYNRQIENHEIYVHDESALYPYCVSITMYPFLLNGLKGLGGDSIAPKHLTSFCGSFINLCFAISSQFCGALATVEFLMYFDYFARKDYDDNYLETHKKEIENSFQQVLYSLNQPASARGYQCVRADKTQLFTPEGFKYLHELKEGDECYTWKNGKLVKQKINKLNVYDYDGELLQFKGNNYQQTVTPNHRVLYKIPNTNKYDIKEAKDLFGYSKLSCPISADNEFGDFQISDDMLQICAAVLCDGSFKKNENGESRIELYLSKNRWGYNNLPNLLEKNGIGFKIEDCKTNTFGEMAHIRISSVDSLVILHFLKHNKTELPHWVTLLSQRQAKLFIETWSKFDGSNTLKKQRKVSPNTKYNLENKYWLQADNEKIADSLQHVCLLAGLGSKKYLRTFNKFNTKELSEKQTFYIETFKRKDKRIKEYNKIQYKGKVWCPSTDAGVVIFREENGIPYISGNSIFWNISIFDKYYLESLFGELVFPDFSKPNFESITKLQAFFMNWFNEERRKALLTFPVVTAAMVVDKEGPLDKDFVDMCAEQDSKGNSFFKYESDSVDSLASCCRLRNELQENTFSYSLGAGGTQSGSLNVITINMNRLVQLAVKNNLDIQESVKQQVEKIHKYQLATKQFFKDFFDANMLDAYKEGFINMDKQFLTIGINGLLESAEFMGLTANNNEKYKEYISKILKVIYTSNKEAKKQYGVMFNTELVPAENLGVKNYNWDKEDGFVVPQDRNCFNSYLYKVEDININAIDKFFLHGKQNLQYLDGGSALHLNLEEYPTKESYKKLYEIAAKLGCNYWTTNVEITVCEEKDCGYIDKRTLDHCSKCGSKNISHATRVIGYLRKIKNFSKERQKEAYKRAKNKVNCI